MKTNILKSLAGTAAIFFATHCANAQTNIPANNASNVSTQNVSTASSGNNSVNGSPSATGVTGVGSTTPANSQTISGNSMNATNIGSTNSVTVTTTNTTVFVNSATATTTSSGANISKGRNLHNLLSRLHNTRLSGKNNLTARLLAAGSNSGNNGNPVRAKVANVATDNSPNNSSDAVTGMQTVNFDLTFFEQDSNGSDTNGTLIKKSVTSSDIIAALGNVTGNNFSSDARLILVDTTSCPGTIEVLDGSNTTDVSSYFTVSNSETQVTSQNGNGSGRINLAALKNGNIRNALNTQETLSILYVTFDSNGVTNANTSNANFGFAVDGLNITHSAATSNSSNAGYVKADVSGTGTDPNGLSAVVTGTITVSGGSNP